MKPTEGKNRTVTGESGELTLNIVTNYLIYALIQMNLTELTSFLYMTDHLF